MDWKKLLAYIAGSVDQELLLRNEYLVTENRMIQVARNVTMADVGFLSTSRYLIHDREGKFCPAFRATIEAVGVKMVKLPARSPSLNAFAERWVKSVKDECLSKLILFGERSLRLALDHYVSHHPTARASIPLSSVAAMPRGPAVPSGSIVMNDTNK